MKRDLLLALVVAVAIVASPAGLGAQPSGSPCVPPGQIVVTDPAGDSQFPEVDILDVAIAEVFAGTHAGKIMVTLRVATLEDGPSGFWNVSWENPTGDTQTSLVMSACAGEASFSYSYSTPDGGQSGIPDAASYTPGGTIEFVVSRDKIGNPETGDVFARISAAAVRSEEASVCLPIPTQEDFTPEPGSYTLGTCVLGVSTAPVHALLALGPAFPNPARLGASFAVEIAEELVGQRIEAGIFDLVGRRLRTIASAAVGPGRTVLSWDLRDAVGARVPTGTYWMKVEIAGHRRSRPILVAR